MDKLESINDKNNIHVLHVLFPQPSRAFFRELGLLKSLDEVFGTMGPPLWSKFMQPGPIFGVQIDSIHREIRPFLLPLLDMG